MANLNKIAKLLCFSLRHNPDQLGLTLQPGGWVNVETLINTLNYNNHSCTMADLDKIVSTDNKQRFSFSEDNTLIRANQGHSISIDLGLEAIEPPTTLYHGTAERFIDAILSIGLIRGQRHHVHMTENQTTALSTGARYGKPVLLVVQSKSMFDDGYVFFKSDNGVWLTDEVPSRYLAQTDE